MSASRNKKRSGRTTGTSSPVVDKARNSTRRQIIWYSNAPWAATGYGQQTAQATKRLRASGHSVAVHANYGLEGSSTVWDGMTIYPRGLAPYSDDVMVAHYLEWANREPSLKPLLITLFDCWVFKSKSLDHVPQIVSWVPIDHTPCPPDVLEWCKKPNVLPVAMSLYGQKMLHQAGVDALYVPHGIEKVFKPTEGGREILEIPDERFVVMMNAANKGSSPPRKGFGENLLAFAVFAKRHPDALLYLHTEQAGFNGVDLPVLLKACGVPEANYQFVDQYAYRAGVSREVLASFYTMADVLLAVSYGEGFGIPVVEAQACGTRVIVSDQTAQPELVGDGWTCKTQPYWDGSQKSWFHIPLVDSILESLEAAYDAPRGVSQKAIDHAAQYEADHVYKTFWEPVIGCLE